MEGKRFGVGLVGGVLFALVIVFGSGVVASGPSGTLSAGSQVVQTSTPMTVSTTNTSTSPALGALSATITSSTYVPFPPGNMTGIKSANTASGPQFSSDLATAGQLPTSSRALLLAPIVVAALLGVLFYRTSISGHGDREEE